MITNREELNFYLAADRFALGIPDRKVFKYKYPVWRYERLLRKCEFLKNTEAPKPIYYFYVLFFNRMSRSLGFSISLNCFGPGLRINHYGLLVVNSKAKIGKWCDIHQGVNIGDNGYIADNGEYVQQVPTIGDFVFIGPGAKLFGDIKIGNDVRISANSVVSSSIADGKSVFGFPSNQTIVEHHSNRNIISTKAFEERFLQKYPLYKKFLCNDSTK